ncbi:hypothetical protein BGZ51_009632 [Haplosporangium sp. Z 767]|nr:hypothetical protein BGZ51_009632 [Haplosporangium sp. Z 767]
MRLDDQFFTITGTNSKLQKQALDALEELLCTRTPAKLVFPRKRFRDVTPSTTESQPDSLSNQLRDLDNGVEQECLGDLEDFNTAVASMDIASPAQEPQHSVEVQIDNRVQDPLEMFYADKRQTTDLPTLLAKQVGCEAEIIQDGRIVIIHGRNRDNVDRCVRQIQRMQEYYLRPQFRLDLVPLVYGSTREEFRLFFVPIQEHSHYSRHIPFIPPSQPTNMNLRNSSILDLKKYCVIEKGIYDQSRGDWAPRSYVRMSGNVPSSPSQTRSGAASPATSHKSGWGTPQPAWSDTSSTNSKQGQSWPESSVPRQVADFGWGTSSSQPLSAGKTSSADNWRPSAQQPVSPSFGGSRYGADSSSRWSTSSSTGSPQSSWSTVGGSSGKGSANRTSKLPSGTVRRLEESDWAAPTFESTSPGDFPILPNMSTPKNKSGMPSLPPLRTAERVPDQGQWPAPAFESAGASDFPTLSTSSPRRKSGMPTLPPPRKVDSSWDHPGRALSGPSSPSQGSTNQPLVIDAEGLAYLGSIPSRSARHGSDNSGLEQPRLRDPAKERADAQRVIRILPNQQASRPQIMRQPESLDDFIRNMQKYDMQRLVQALRQGLKELQGQRKEIRLIGRLGCVLYPAKPSALNRPWDYRDLETVVKENCHSSPLFCPLVTTVKDHVNKFLQDRGPVRSDTAHFEVECDTRNNPSSRYVRTIVTVPTTIAILDRVVTPWKTYGEVMWDSLDKSQDFEFLLQAREGVIPDTKSALGRTNVKPFSNFRKKLSIGHITCHNIPDYLNVISIIFRHTKTYDWAPGFTMAVHKVEERKLLRNKGTDTVTGCDRLQTWFEFELCSTDMQRRLDENLELIPGTMADWEVEDIIGEGAEVPGELEKMVKEMME